MNTALGNDMVALISAGCHHSLAVTGSDNGLYTWGQNTSGQLGDGTTDDRSKPVPVPELRGVQVVDGGREHTIVVLDDNTVRSWGGNGSGQLGNGNTTDSTSPVTTLTALTGIDKIAAAVGGDFSCATRPGSELDRPAGRLAHRRHRMDLVGGTPLPPHTAHGSPHQLAHTVKGRMQSRPPRPCGPPTRSSSPQA